MKIDFDKMQGLVPAIIQDADTKQVLMLGYMNQQLKKIFFDMKNKYVVYYILYRRIVKNNT